MRFPFFALALFVADMTVEAGVCKPARTTASQSVPTTLTETSGVSSTESLTTSATETLSSDSSIATWTSSTLAGTTSTELVSTTTTEAASTTTTEAATTTTTVEASTITTEEASTTTTSDAGPSVTPGSIIGTGPVAGLTLQGSSSTRYTPLSFATSDSAQTLIFTFVNNQLSAGNNNYLCMTYKAQGVLGPLVLCPFDNYASAPLRCQRLPSGTLSCTAPNGSCMDNGSCRRPNNAIPFSQFYVDASQAGYFGPASGDFSGYTAIDLILAE